MPRYSFDEDTFEEFSEYMDEPLDTSKYDRTDDGQLTYYEPAEAKVDVAQFLAVSAQTYQQLVEQGATEILARYDGGYDEGFAYFESATINGESVPVEALAGKLAPGPAGEKPEEPHIWYGEEMEAKLTRTQRAKDALDALAYNLASALLGNGFGTGEMALAGRFRVDLKSGQIVDIPDEDASAPSESE